MSRKLNGLAKRSQNRLMMDLNEDWQTRKTLAQTNLYMLENEIACDVTFRVGSSREVIRAHKFIMISRSHVFATMFTGVMAEQGEVDIPDVDATVFKLFLRFLYTNNLEIKSDSVMHLLYLAKKYSTGTLEDICRKFLETSLTAENACTILEQAKFFSEKELEKRAMDCILKKGKEAVKSSDFFNLSQSSLLEVVKNDDFQVEEEDVFNAVFEWAKNRCQKDNVDVNTESLRKVLGDVVQQIRFPLMDREFFVKTVGPSRMLTDKERLMISDHMTCKDLPVVPFSDKKRKVHEVYICDNCGFDSNTEFMICNSCNYCKSCGMEAINQQQGYFNRRRGFQQPVYRLYCPNCGQTN